MSEHISTTKIIGIAGGSGSGKTTLAKEIVKILGKNHALILSQDNYYFDQSAKFDMDGGSVNFDHPDAIDFYLMAKHLLQLRSGNAVEIPIYDFATHQRLTKTQKIYPHPFILLDGILILAQSTIRDLLYKTIFVDTPEATRFARRLYRDTHERGRTPKGVREQFQRQVKPMHDQFVEDSKIYADLICDGKIPMAESLEKILSLMEIS